MKNILTFANTLMFALFAILTAISLSGCIVANIWDHNTVAGEGNLELFEIKTAGFNGIKIRGFCDVKYYNAPSDKVTLEVQPNLREYFVVEVIDNVLVVNTTKRINASLGKTPVLTVSVPVLNSLAIEGAGTFTAYDKITSDSFRLELSGAGSGNAELDVKNININLSGAGNFELSGRAESLDLLLTGAASLNALLLQTREAKIQLSGAGTVRVSCSDKLMVNASGAGKVEYRGNPSLSINNNGLVSVKRVD
jgi:hypothetical protein